MALYFFYRHLGFTMVLVLAGLLFTIRKFLRVARRPHPFQKIFNGFCAHAKFEKIGDFESVYVFENDCTDDKRDSTFLEIKDNKIFNYVKKFWRKSPENSSLFCQGQSKRIRNFLYKREGDLERAIMYYSYSITKKRRQKRIRNLVALYHFPQILFTDFSSIANDAPECLNEGILRNHGINFECFEHNMIVYKIIEHHQADDLEDFYKRAEDLFFLAVKWLAKAGPRDRLDLNSAWEKHQFKGTRIQTDEPIIFH